MKTLKKIGLLGGAFDPITIGHIQLAEFVLENTDLDEIKIVPCHSHMYNKKMASANHRLKMIDIAVQNKTNIKSFDFEIKNKIKGGTYNFISNLFNDPTYSSDAFKFSYIIGLDNAITFDKWKSSEKIKKALSFVVVTRQGISYKMSTNMWFLKPPHVFLNAGNNIIECSSTIARTILQENKHELFNNYVETDVLSYIQNNNLYGTGRFENLKKYKKKVLNKKQYREMLNDICSEYCDPGHYCILKEFLISSHPSPRLLMQMKCIDKFKYERGVKENRNVEWTEAMELWVEENYAQKFAEVYEEGKKINQIYRETITD